MRTSLSGLGPALVLLAPVLLALATPAAPQVPVTIHWDAENVPSIVSDTTAGALFGEGYALASCQYVTVKLRYAQAMGRLAEYMGSGASGEAAPGLDGVTFDRELLSGHGGSTGSLGSNVASDLRVKTLGVPQMAEQVYAEMDPQVRSLVDAFAAGIGAYFVDHEQELLAATNADELLAAPTLPQEVVASAISFFLLSHTSHALKLVNGHSPAPACSAGTNSNEWAIRGDKTLVGNPMLLVDPHTVLQKDPAIRPFLHAIFSPRLRAVGFNLLGLPLMQLGVKLARPGIAGDQSVAWTVTSSTLDQFDVYEVTTDPLGHPGEYLFDGRWVAFATSEIDVLVNGGEDLLGVPVRASVHGPVIAVSEDSAFALRSPLFLSADIIGQLYEMLHCQDMQGFRVALAEMAWPGGNIAVASNATDMDEQIMYMLYGPSPDRPAGVDWKQIVDGGDPATLWTSLRRMEALPAATGADQDHFINCNVSIDQTFAGFDVAAFPQDMVGCAGLETYRQRRAQFLIGPARGVTFEDMQAWTVDDRYGLAADAIEELKVAASSYGHLAAQPSQISLDELLTMLDGWDKRASGQGANKAATIMLFWEKCFAEYGLVGSPGWTLVGDEALSVQALDSLALAFDLAWYADYPDFGEVHRIERKTPDGPVSFRVGGSSTSLRNTSGPEIVYAFDFESAGYDPDEDVCKLTEFDLTSTQDKPYVLNRVEYGQLCPIVVELGPDAASTRLEYLKSLDNCSEMIEPFDQSFSTVQTKNWAAQAFRPLATTPEQAAASAVRTDHLFFPAVGR